MSGTFTEDTAALESSTRDMPSLKSPEAAPTGGFSRSHCPSLFGPAISSPSLHFFSCTATPPHPFPQQPEQHSCLHPLPHTPALALAVAKPLNRGPRAGESWKYRSVEPMREAGPQLENRLRCSSEQTPRPRGDSQGLGLDASKHPHSWEVVWGHRGSGGTPSPCELEWGFGFGSETSLS